MKTVYICTKLGPEVEPFYCDSLAQAVDRWLDSWACIGYRAPAELYADLTRHCPCSVLVCEVDDEKLAAAECLKAANEVLGEKDALIQMTFTQIASQS